MGACSSRSAIAKEASDPSARPALPLSTVTAPAFVELDDLSPRVSFTITAQPPPPVSGSPPKTAPLKRKCVAFAVCSFVAQEPDELTVHAGEFVDILDDQQVPVHWCHCRRYSNCSPHPLEGLVPWSHLISALHAEVDASLPALTLDPSDEPISPECATHDRPIEWPRLGPSPVDPPVEPEPLPGPERHPGLESILGSSGARLRQVRREVRVNRDAKGIGIVQCHQDLHHACIGITGGIC